MLQEGGATLTFTDAGHVKHDSKLQDKASRTEARALADHTRLGFGAMLLGLPVSEGHILDLGWLLSELHSITRHASAAAACLQVRLWMLCCRAC